MDPKKLYFFLGNIAGLAAAGGVVGTNAALSDDPITGVRQAVHFETVVNPMPQSAATAMQNALMGAPCNAVDAKHGDGACNPATVDYDNVYRRTRGQTFLVYRFPGHDVALRRTPIPPAHLAWIENRIALNYCPKFEARYGAGSCDSTTIDFLARFIRTNGAGRIKVELDDVAYCTGASLPTDPEPLELEAP